MGPPDNAELRATDALDLIAGLVAWADRHRLFWDLETAAVTPNDDRIVWSAQPPVGGRVGITREIGGYDKGTTADLVKIADEIVATAFEVDCDSADRAAFEQEVRDEVKTLLRRKAHRGMRLVEVQSESIPLGRYYDIGAEVTLEFEHEGKTNRHTMGIEGVDNLEEEFEWVRGQYT